MSGINDPGYRAPSRLPQQRLQRSFAMLGEEFYEARVDSISVLTAL